MLRVAITTQRIGRSGSGQASRSRARASFLLPDLPGNWHYQPRLSKSHLADRARYGLDRCSEFPVNGARHLGKALSVGRVLVIEDDDRIARLVSRALENEGFPTERAATGPTGLSSALAADFDLVVLDLMLPGLDGRQVLTRLLD